MKKPTLVIIALVAIVLLPMWYIAMQSPHPTEEVALDYSVSEIRPLEGFVPTPNELSPSQVGVIVWVALFALLAVLVAVHRFMNTAVRPSEPQRATADGGTRGSRWLTADGRWIVEYHDASEGAEGIAAMGGLTVLAIVFAALFTGEYLTLARTQFFGIYAAGMFLSLALLTVAYYAWFMPHVEVAEYRGHSK